MTFNQNQKLLLHNGGWWALYDGLTSAYIIAFALALGANNTIVGILSALPFIATLFGEIPGAKLLERFTGLQIYLWASTLGRLSWTGVILAPFLFPTNPLLAVVLFFFVAKTFEYTADPSWTVLLANVVPSKIRGNFIATRSTIIGTAGMIALVAAGWYLDLFAVNDLRGFFIVFGIGILCGLTTTAIATRIKAPASGHIHHGFKEFFHLEGDLKRFTFFTVCFNFAYMLASPFFTAYILDDLGQPYAIFAISTALATICKLAVYRHMGRLSDKYGDKPILLLSVIGTALVPLAFIFVTPERLWLLWFAQALAGITWAGYDVTIFNMFLSLTTPDKRPVQTATYAIVTSVPLVIAPIVGGYLADNVAIGLVGIPLLFAISTILRAISSMSLFSIPDHRVRHDYPLAEVFQHIISVQGMRTRWTSTVKTVKRGVMFALVR